MCLVKFEGTIPTEIGLLRALLYQDCDTNFLTGTIPTQLARMESLETLWLNNNMLTGKIPSEIGLMSNLSSLYLTNNLLTGTMPEEICALNLDNLEVNCDSVRCDCCSNCVRATQPPSADDPLLDLLTSVAPDGGQTLRDSTTPQYRALQWLRSPLNSNIFSNNQRLIQRFALATFYLSTGGDFWDKGFLWLTSANECLWFSTSDSESICDDNDNYIALDLRNNNLRGTVPIELTLLKDTLGKYRISKRFKIFTTT